MGKGPKIKVEQLCGIGNKERYGVYRGHIYPEQTKILYLDVDLVNDIEDLKNSEQFREEISFLIAVTILHEYTHLGDIVFGDSFWSDLFFDSWDTEDEVGIQFENTIFGETVWRSNAGIIMRNFGDW